MADRKTTTDLRPAAHRSPLARPTTPTSDVYVDPGAQPKVAEYVAGAAARALERRGGGLQKYTAPVGGGLGPAVPRLDAEHEVGRTMETQAENVNSPPIHQQMADTAAQMAPGSIVEPPTMAPVNFGGPPRSSATLDAQQLGLLPGDMLPAEAQKDPEYQTGSGAVFAISQPRLAGRYGVVRNGQRLMPQQLLQARGGTPRQGLLRPETLKGLEDLAELRKKQSPEAMREAEERAEKQVEGTAAAHSVNAGETIGKPLTDEERDKAARAIEMMDSFDFEGFRESMRRDIINNPEQKKIIEERLEPLDINDLITKNRVSQRVIIVPKKFEVVFTSMTGEDDLALKGLIMEESKSVEVTERYLLDKFAFMALACGLTSVNNNNLPRHLNPDGEFDKTLFWKKFHWVIKRPLHMLSSIGVNHTWFEMRVRRLFVAEKVGNG
jgi:hypothetical protein